MSRGTYFGGRGDKFSLTPPKNHAYWSDCSRFFPQGPRNAALNRPSAQSSVAHLGDSSKAVDGNTDSDYRTALSCTHTEENGRDPWWRVTLKTSCFISHIDIANRVDAAWDRLTNFEIRVGKKANAAA